MCRRRGAVALALLLSLLIAGCGSAHRSTEVLRLPIYDPIHTADPALASTPSDTFIASLLYSGLVKFSPDLHVIPELAVSIPTISSSGRVYTFTVRHDARFADGRQVTARDVAYSLTRALRLGGPRARHYLGGIEGASRLVDGQATVLSGVRVVHRLTLRIQLWQADADFLQKLAFPIASVVDRRVGGQAPLRSWVTAGTGPWRVAQQARDGALTLVPRAHYYGPPLHLHSLVLRPVRGDDEALSLYRKNALDAARVPVEAQKGMAGHADFHQSNAPDGYYALPRGPSMTALAAKLDRDRLVRDAGFALSPLNTIVPPTVPDYVSSPPNLPDDPTSPPVRTVRITAPRDPVARAVARALARQWPTAAGGSRLNRRSNEPDVTVVRASYVLPDPGVWLRLVLPQTRSSWYRASLRHADLLTNDPVSRMDIYDQCERWALEKGFVVPLASSSLGYLIKPAVQSLQVTPLGIMPENDNWSTVDVT